MIESPSRRRSPSRIPRSTVESSAPPEPVTTATVTNLGVSQHNLRIERLFAEALKSDAGEPIAVVLPITITRESGNYIDPDELDEEMPGMDSPDDSSEDDGLPPVVSLAARARAPAGQGTEQGTPFCPSPTLHN